MKQPILSAAFVAAAPSTIFDPASARLLLKRHDDAVLNEVDWPLAKLAAKGYDGACLMVGNGALRLLERAHPDVFAAYPGLTPPPAAVATTEVLIIELVERSRRYQTCRYVDTIDDLIARLDAGPAKLGHTSLPAQWPDIRRELLLYSN